MLYTTSPILIYLVTGSLYLLIPLIYFLNTILSKWNIICRSKHRSQFEILTLHQEFTGQIIFFNGRKSLNWWGGPTLNLQVAKFMLAKKWLKGHTQRAEQSWDGNVCPVPFPVPLPTSPMLCLPHPSTFRFKARNKTGSQRQRFPLQAKRYQNINKVIKTPRTARFSNFAVDEKLTIWQAWVASKENESKKGLKEYFRKIRQCETQGEWQNSISWPEW